MAAAAVPNEGKKKELGKAKENWMLLNAKQLCTFLKKFNSKNKNKTSKQNSAAQRRNKNTKKKKKEKHTHFK